MDHLTAVNPPTITDSYLRLSQWLTPRFISLTNDLHVLGNDGVPESERYQVIGVGLFNGAGTAAILIASLSLTAQLIGKNTSTAAFVYGAMSLTDKIANGIAVIIGILTLSQVLDYVHKL